jgi:hypothetical protein
MKPPAQKRLEALEKRRLSHNYIPGTEAFDKAIRELFFRIKARACLSCPQNDDTGSEYDANMCIQNCPTFDEAEAAEASLLNQDNLLERILYERVMGTRHG